jgi:hypothetical protein
MIKSSGNPESKAVRSIVHQSIILALFNWSEEWKAENTQERERRLEKEREREKANFNFGIKLKPQK